LHHSGTTNQSTTPNTLIEFFALSTIAKYLSDRRIKSAQDRKLVRDCVFVHATLPPSGPPARAPHPPYIVTAQALVLALCVKEDYPTSWPSPFTLLRSTSASHPELFCRVLQALVDEVVDFDEARTKEERERDSFVKDAMRGISEGGRAAAAGRRRNRHCNRGTNTKDGRPRRSTCSSTRSFP